MRSAMCGSFLSGGLAGHFYGAEGIWGADVEPAAPIHMWCSRGLVRGARPSAVYAAQWFDPRRGEWRNVGDRTVRANNTGEIQLPEFPGDAGWGLKLVHRGPISPPKHF